MWLLDKLAEQRIREAAEQGAFEQLPGAGKPLPLEDHSLVPEDLRTAYRVLKNAGYLPPELQDRQEALRLEQLLRSIDEPVERIRAQKRLDLLRARFGGERIDPVERYSRDLSTKDDWRDAE